MTPQEAAAIFEVLGYARERAHYLLGADLDLPKAEKTQLRKIIAAAKTADTVVDRHLRQVA